MTEGVVYDLGYRPHEGERLGRAGAVRALYRDGLRRVLGLRRRARAKALPWGLLAIAVIPAIFFVGITVFTREIGAEDVDFFSHAQYFDLTGTIALLFIAAAAGELLVPDRVHGVLQVYASRPLTTSDYLTGRAAALAAVVFGFMYFPHLVLFFGRAWTSRRRLRLLRGRATPGRCGRRRWPPWCTSSPSPPSPSSSPPTASASPWGRAPSSGSWRCPPR